MKIRSVAHLLVGDMKRNKRSNMKQKLTIQGREVIIEGRVLNEPLKRDSFAYDKPKKFPPYRIYWSSKDIRNVMKGE